MAEREGAREAGRRSSGADLAADIETAIHQGDRLKRELHEERLWRKRYGRLFLVVMVFMLGVLAYLTGIARTNQETGRQTRCTQDFIVDIVNPASEVGARVRHGLPITNPCRR